MDNIKLISLLNERKTISNGIRFRPTIFDLLKKYANDENMSIADKIEAYVLQEYEKRKE